MQSLAAATDQPTACWPDATAEGWVCGPESSRPAPAQRPRSSRAAGAATDATPATDGSAVVGNAVAVEVAPNTDPLTGISSDPADWYVPTNPRPASAEHGLQQDLAERYYVAEPQTGADGVQCPGGYELRTYPHPVDSKYEDFPIVAEADQLSSVVDESVELRGNVTIEQGNRLVYAPSAQLDQVSRQVTFSEGVRLDQPGVVMQGADASLNLDDDQASMQQAQFLLTEANLRGQATQLEQGAAGELSLTDTRFTRCEPGNNGWRMDARNLEIEDGEVFGTARGAVVRLKSVPIFYTPYLKFPVTDERVSGFLFPNISHSAEDGLDVSIPYYLNLAPNYDATLIPRVVGERGVGFEGEFRHKQAWQDTVLAASILPEDDLFNGELDYTEHRELGGAPVLGEFQPADRWLTAIDHRGYIGDFRTVVDYTAVSDRDYFRDLGSDLGLSSRRELQRRGEVQYNSGGLFARLWAQRFQRLDEVTTEEYQRLPELEMVYSADLFGPLSFSVGGKWSSFDRNVNRLNGLAAVTGERAHIEPRLRLGYSWPFGFFNASGGYRYTTYDLDSPDRVVLEDTKPDRAIGVANVDAGLFFERELDWFDTPLIQTLEPRVYYLWQEFEDQAGLPRFETSELTFGYNQLFRDNRFSGLDRIGDADQVSLGVTTRFISATNGKEYFRASIGEIFYFQDRRVTLFGAQAEDDLQSSSALASELSASLWGNWRIFGNLVWDPHQNEVDEGGGGVSYRRDNRHIFNLGFRNRRDSDLEQTDISIYWPLSKSFAIMGRWNYDLISKRTIEGFGGLEYSDCCLQIRLMARRFLDSRNEVFDDVEGDDGIFLQIVFKGLAGFGTKVESVLERGVRGYRSPQQRDYFSN